MSLNIVNLIEHNPITKLNGNYQSKLVNKVKEQFSNYEQQIFLSSFYCYLNYNKSDFVINLDDIWKWLGFGQKVKGKILLENNFTINVDYKILLSQKQDTVTHGGHNKETFMLNVKTFKLFCIKAGTKKANEIHEYFIKLEEILQEIVFEESEELKLQLNQQIEKMNKIEDNHKQELEKQKIIEREKILLKEYGTIGSIIYIIKVKTYDNGNYVIKIGESRKGILERYKEHKYKFEECLLLDCFAINNSKDFESFIHSHETIKTNKVSDLLGHETELELFLIGKKLSYQHLLTIIDNNIKYFNNNNTHKLELENEQLKLMLEMKTSNNDNLLIHELIKTVKHLSSKMDHFEKINEELITKINSSQTKVVSGFNEPLATLGPRLLKINPENLKTIQVYESVSELMKENNDIKRPSINKAIAENTIYCGYRWLNVDRDVDPNTIQNISPTKVTKIQNVGYVAQLNKEQTSIINVFIDRKTAAQFNGYISASALDNPVKQFTLSNGYYYKLYDTCSLQLRVKFEDTNGKPLLYKNGIGQYDLQNHLIQEFICKYDCIKILSMSDKTLTKALNNKKPYNGFYFKEIGSKLMLKSI